MQFGLFLRNQFTANRSFEREIKRLLRAACIGRFNRDRPVADNIRVKLFKRDIGNFRIHLHQRLINQYRNGLFNFGMDKVRDFQIALGIGQSAHHRLTRLVGQLSIIVLLSDIGDGPFQFDSVDRTVRGHVIRGQHLFVFGD